jgi:hypothetical protein
VVHQRRARFLRVETQGCLPIQREDDLRVTRLSIQRWRNIRDITFEIPSDARLICLVGENGTGKSHILELLSYSAAYIGLSPGFAGRRGNPQQEEHEFSFVLDLAPNARHFLPQELPPHLQTTAAAWDGTLMVHSVAPRPHSPAPDLRAGGIENLEYAHQLAQHIRSGVQTSSEIYYLYLDADRAYPPKYVSSHEYADALRRDFSEISLKRQFASQGTTAMYDDWLRYLVARESQIAVEYTRKVRVAQEQEQPAPRFEDPFVGYKAALQSVLPHLRYYGAEDKQGAILFDSAGTLIPFPNLSSGEREIAFLVGQIDRYHLQNGLLLLDEPEAHLNSDLVRAWIAFLRDTVEAGQVWIASHALEAAEVAGPDATFVLERAAESREVTRVTSLHDRPAYQVLSAALGSPGFAISRLRFVFIEGDQQNRERERFHNLTGNQSRFRFIEAGGCRDVVRSADTVRQLARETGDQLSVTGVVDRDFRTDDEAAQYSAARRVFVLGCHEIENFFLHPSALSAILQRLDRNPAEAQGVIQAASDAFAGLWILDCAAFRSNELIVPASTARAHASALNWQKFSASPEEHVAALAAAQAKDTCAEDAVREMISAAYAEYAQLRESEDLWRFCIGKQTLRMVFRPLEFHSTSALERSVLRLWSDEQVTRPKELMELLQHLSGDVV